jgi:hypothetical protein
MKHQLQGAVFAKMSSNRGVITGLNDIATELFIIGDIEFFLVIDKSTLFFPFKEATYKLVRSFGFEILKCLSYRELTSEAVLDMLFKQWHRNFG